MKPTKQLSKKDYPTKCWTVQDLIKEAVRKEELRFIKDQPHEIRPDTRKHPMQWTEITKRCFSKDIISFILP